jgi:hypothetical protein
MKPAIPDQIPSKAAPQTDEMCRGIVVGDIPAALVLADAGSLARNVTDRGW